MKIVVIGGTGLIGAALSDRLRRDGADVLVAAPSTGVDTRNALGLERALAGARVVVDVSNSPSPNPEVAMDFFRNSARNITAAEIKAGVEHHVVLSIVGIERLQESGYFRAKRAQEEQVRRAGVPYTLLHATQFFEFIKTIADAATTDGAVRLPPARFQPVAAQEVADRLSALALGSPINATLEFAGPEELDLGFAVNKCLAAGGDPRAVLEDSGARYFGACIRADELLPAPGADRGAITLIEWLTTRSRRTHLE